MNNSYIPYTLRCVSCEKEMSEKQTTSRCLSCGSALDVIYDYDILWSRINTYLLESAAPRVLKYLNFYPLIGRNNLFTLYEGGTALQHAKFLGKKMGLSHLYIKNEGLNPTGAFKDRGTFVELNKAKELGFTSVCVASTGNMAASVSAYAAQAGMDCYVFVPENTPRGKLAQSLAYGAKVIQIRGTYNDANALAEKAAEKYGFYLAGDYVFRAEGQKSIGYEIAEQMKHVGSIDWVVVPVGMGTNFSAIYKGFWEYKKLGVINYMPRMIAVQADGAHSIFWNDEKKEYVTHPVAKPQTVCSAIAVGDPLDGPKVIRGLKESGGYIESVSDEETLIAQLELAHTEALYVEPSSATTIVAVRNLIEKGIISPNDKIVCVATGLGLKDPAQTLKVLAEPPTIEPDLNEVNRVISGKLFAIRAGAVKEKEKMLFANMPADEDVKQVVLDEFSIELTEEDVKRVRNELSDFITHKGKNIAKADLQSILETVIQQNEKNKYLELVDYHITDSKKKRPVAQIEAILNGSTYKEESEGVGPVDAAINALKKMIEEHGGVSFRLTDFNVEISTTGSDSTVEATMVLLHTDGTQVVEKGTSPDIIVASMNAFVKGYNELVYQVKERNS